jgi:hypothetical protein
MARRRLGENSDASARKQERRRQCEDAEEDGRKHQHPFAAKPVAERAEGERADRGAEQRGGE